MIDPLIRNFQEDIVLLQRFIERRQAAGLNDMQRMVESLSIRIFRALENCELENKNLMRVNYPAIDLADDNKRIAVQVTVKATPAKIRKTIEIFENNHLQNNYDRLYILGFCKAAKVPVPSYCTVVDMDYVVNRLIDHGREDDLQEIVDGIRRHQSYENLHPWDDVDCLEIVLNCIDRSAIKHRMSCEGSITDMLKGLKEVSELIGKGKINGRTKSKSLDDFHDREIISFLRSVKDAISDILAIVNKSIMPDSRIVNIEPQDMLEIDRLKEHIAAMANEIAKK